MFPELAFLPSLYGNHPKAVRKKRNINTEVAFGKIRRELKLQTRKGLSKAIRVKQKNAHKKVQVGGAAATV